MLPARNRMTRSTDFSVTVSRGVRSAQSDLVLHVLAAGEISADGPRVGLIVGKAVGNAVVRHRVSRQLRHASRDLLPELHTGDRVVIRALPKSSAAQTVRLQAELRQALTQVRAKSDRSARPGAVG